LPLKSGEFGHRTLFLCDLLRFCGSADKSSN
jgi:hypothetical protein